MQTPPPGRRLSGIAAPAVEVDAVGPGMGIDPVQNKAHSKGRRLLTETDEVLRAAQNGVGTHIVCAVVSVVGAGLDDGVEINAAHTQPLQIRELFLNAPESAAVKIIRAVSGLKGRG